MAELLEANELREKFVENNFDLNELTDEIVQIVN